jgi:hypothetical protein
MRPLTVVYTVFMSWSIGVVHTFFGMVHFGIVHTNPIEPGKGPRKFHCTSMMSPLMPENPGGRLSAFSA